MTSFPIRFTPGTQCTHWKDGRTGTVTSFGRALHGRYVVTLEDADGTRFRAYVPHLIHERDDDKPTIDDLERGHAELHAELAAHAATCDGCADQLKSGRPVSCYAGKLLRTDMADLSAVYEVLHDGGPIPPAPAAPVQEALWPVRRQPPTTDLPRRHIGRSITDVHLPT